MNIFNWLQRLNEYFTLYGGGGKGGGGAPDHPDYPAQTILQAKLDREAADRAATADRPNSTDVYGNQTTWTQAGGGDTLDQAAYNRAMADYNTSVKASQASSAGGGIPGSCALVLARAAVSLWRFSLER